MNAIAAALSRLAAVLDQRKRRCALVGGLAVSCHVDPRFTRDVDVAVAVADDADAEALIRSLATDGSAVSTAIDLTRQDD